MELRLNSHMTDSATKSKFQINKSLDLKNLAWWPSLQHLLDLFSAGSLSFEPKGISYMHNSPVQELFKKWMIQPHHKKARSDSPWEAQAARDQWRSTTQDHFLCTCFFRRTRGACTQIVLTNPIRITSAPVRAPREWTGEQGEVWLKILR